MSDDDPFPHKKHDVVQWTHEPVAGYPHTSFYCYECHEFGRIQSGVSL